LSDIFDEDTQQKIEDKSHAVLIRDTDHRLIIQGSDQLHVLLALSIIEDIVARFETNVGESARHNSSSMLDTVLKRAYSNDDEAEDDGFYWSTMPEEVKRAVLVSLLDNDDVPEATITNVDDVTEEQFKQCEITAGFSNRSTAGSSRVATTESVNSIASSAAATVVADLPNPRLDIADPTIQPLVKLAMSKDYTRDEIETILNKASQWKESEFLRALHTNRRLQVATTQHSPPFDSEACKRPRVSDIGAKCSLIDKNEHVSQHHVSPLCCAFGPNIVGGSTVSNIGSCAVKNDDTRMDVDEVPTVASPKCVILLKSDEEMENSDDEGSERMSTAVDINSKLMALAAESSVPLSNSATPSEPAARMSTAVDINSKLMALAAESSVPLSNSATPGEPAANYATADSNAACGSKKKKKKRKKKNLLLPITVCGEEKPGTKTETGDDVTNLDCISLIPTSASGSTMDMDSDVLVVSDDSGSDLEVMVEDQLDRRMDGPSRVQSRSSHVHYSSTINSIGNSETNHNQHFPSSTVSSIPAVGTGNRKSTFM